MAEPTQAQLDQLAKDFMAELSNEREPCPYLKAAVVAAIAATNTWQASNAASFNAALPAPFRNSATPQQKARLFRLVSELRWKTS